MNKLGKYQIRRTLGKGAMGIVYEGFDPIIERTVAIKTILPSQLNSSEYANVMARFKREAQAAGRLNHPGIVAIYDYGEEIAQDIDEDEATMMAAPTGAKEAQRVAFIAMEFVKGRELRDFFEAGERFPVEQAVRITSEVLDALNHAHEHGVVHRDIKPANLIVLDNGRIKVADFGIARIEKSELTQAGTVLGTPSYMSPEQFMGQPVDARSDLFSCGVVLYQLLTGEKPFTGETTTTVMYKVLREEPVPPSALNTTLEPALDAVMKRALAKQPSQRFQSAREFAQALQDALAGSSQSTVVSSPTFPPAPAFGTRPQPQPVAPAEAPAAPVAPIATRKGVPAGVWAAAAAAAVAVIAGGYILFGPGRPAAPTVAQAPAPAAAPVTATQVPAPVAAPVAATQPAPAAEPGTLVISAVGLVDPKEARFNGNVAAAQQEAHNNVQRQLVEKALALYVDRGSLDSHRALIDQKLLANSGSFIRTVLQEGAPSTGAGGLVETQARAVVNARDVQKSLNQLSREERVEFIRNKGDPRISLRIDIANTDGALGHARSQLAENVVKERIKSFGFRVWSDEGDAPKGANAQVADFAIRGEVKVKQLTARLQASGLTITKTALTSWTIKAIDVATGEEVYLNTRMPTGQSWASEDQALADIGKLVGDEFSRNFFLQHFAFRTQKSSLVISGLPQADAPLLLRELRGMRQVLDAQLSGGTSFQLQLPEGNVADLIQEAVIRPLNQKLGQDCFALAGTSGPDVTVSFAPTCATAQMRSRLEAGPPAGWPTAPPLQPPAKTPTVMRNTA